MKRLGLAVCALLVEAAVVSAQPQGDDINVSLGVGKRMATEAACVGGTNDGAGCSTDSNCPGGGVCRHAEVVFAKPFSALTNKVAAAITLTTAQVAETLAPVGGSLCSAMVVSAPLTNRGLYGVIRTNTGVFFVEPGQELRIPAPSGGLCEGFTFVGTYDGDLAYWRFE